MPINFPDGSTIETPDELEALIKAKRWPRDKAQAARLEHQREMIGKQIAAARARVPGASIGPSPLSFAANAANTMGLGAPVAGAAALTAPVTALSRGIGVGDAYQLNRAKLDQLMNASPVSATAGKIAGFLTPASPAGAVAKAGFRAAGGVRLAELAAKGTAPGAKWAGQLASAMIGSAGAIAATNAAQYPFNEKSAAETVKESIEGIKDPLNVGLTVGLGGFAAAARHAPDLPTRNLLAWAERSLPGFRPSPDMVRDPDGFLASVMDAAAKSPQGRRTVSEYAAKHFYEPMRKSVDAIAKAAGLSRGNTPSAVQMATDKAGSAIQRLVAKDAAGKPAAGSLAARSKEVTDAAFAADGGVAVPSDSLARIGTVLDSLDARAAAKGPLGDLRSSGWSSVLGQFRAAAKHSAETGTPIPAQAMEDFRQTVAGFSKFRAGPDTPISLRDVREAREVYGAVRESLRRTSSTIDRALSTAADLHEAQRMLGNVVNAQSLTQAQTVLQTVQAPGFAQRWRTLKQQLTAEELDAVRGSYLGQFLADVAVRRGTATKPRDALNLRAMERAWNKTGPYQKTIFDTIFDGARTRAELLTRGRISDAFLRSGIGRAEGSQTAGRQAVLDAADEALDATQQIVTSNPGALKNAFGFVLGQAGRFGLINAVLNGRLRNFLMDAGTGKPLAVGTTVPAALQNAGGTRAVFGAGQSVGDELGSYEE